MGKKRVHPFVIRVPYELWGEAQVLHFKHQTSMNLLLIEMISFALSSDEFLNFMVNEYPPNYSRGHFIYVRDGGGQ